MKNGNKPSHYHGKRDTRSMFPGNREHHDAVRLIDSYLATAEKDSDGMVPIGDLVKHLLDSGMGWASDGHVYEIFIRDVARVYRVDDGRFGRVLDNNSYDPPINLWFGTTTSVRSVIRENGIKSTRRTYSKLHETPEQALEYASRFTGDGAKACVLQVKAADAAMAGMVVSKSRVPGEWLTDTIPPIYIVPEVKPGRIQV